MRITLREITKQDWDFILNLRNESFNNFFEQNKIISKKQHYEYLTKQEDNPNFHHWIGKNEIEDLGYVRILENDVSIVILKKFQNKGIGTILLKLLEKKAIELKIKKLTATILIENKSSEKIFLKNNFILKISTYEKKIFSS